MKTGKGVARNILFGLSHENGGSQKYLRSRNEGEENRLALRRRGSPWTKDIEGVSIRRSDAKA